MNSVAKARARSVKGSIVESVRVANDTVNMLLQKEVTHQHPSETVTFDKCKQKERSMNTCATYFNA